MNPGYANAISGDSEAAPGAGHHVAISVAGTNRLAASGAANFDLIVTDLILAIGLSGDQLAQRLTALKPDMKVVLISGYSIDLVAQHLARYATDALVQKPSSVEQLHSFVRERLDSTR